MSESRLKFLHRAYCHSGRWGWQSARRIRSFGWGMVLITTLSAVLGTEVEDSAIYMIFCFAVCSLIMSFIWIFCRDAKISATRSLPEFGSVGEELQYTVQVKNDHSKTIAALLFEEWPPDPSPSYESFANTPEPGEEKRNIVDRTMLFYRWTWLQERERGFNILEAKQSPRQLASQESQQVTFHLTPQHRGILQLAELRVLLPDPFGLFQRCQRVNAPRDQLVILPKRYPFSNFSLTGKAPLQLRGEVPSNSIGQTGDFLHLRDYQPGDAMRSVDWKSWARTGSPVIREYEDNFLPHYALILDTSAPAGDRFEEAVSITSSLVASTDCNQCLLDFIFIGEKSYPIAQAANVANSTKTDKTKKGQGIAHRSKLLELLAIVEANPQYNNLAHYTALQALINRENQSHSALLLIFPHWSELQQDFLTALRSQGHQVTAFIIADNATKESFLASPIPDVYLIHLDNIARDLALATAQLETLGV